MESDGFNVIILGYGSFAEESMWLTQRYAEEAGYGNPLFQHAVRSPIQESQLATKDLRYGQEFSLVWGIVEPEVRKSLYIELLSQGINPSQFLMLADKTADFADNSSIGRGSQLFPRAYVGPGCIIFDHVSICSGAIIGPGCSIGDYSFIGSGVNIGHGSNIRSGVKVGLGATITSGTTIGEMSFIAPGALVKSDVPARSNVSSDGLISAI